MGLTGSRAFFDKDVARQLRYVRHPLHRQQKLKRYEHAAEMGEISRLDAVLEIGCGLGSGLPGIASKCKNYVGADFSLNALAASRKKGKYRNAFFIAADARHLPLGNGRFDVVLMVDTLANLGGPKTAILEARRVLRHDGRLLLSVPNIRSLYGIMRGALGKRAGRTAPPAHRWHSIQTICGLLETSGFAVQDIRGSFFLPPFFTGKRYLLPSSPVLPRLYGNIEDALSSRLKGYGYHLILKAVKGDFRPEKISVILPTCNEMANIQGLIEAILQSLRGYATEIIVVDDRSTDGTPRAVERLMGAKGNVRLAENAGKGIAGALRKGVQLSTGDAVVWMDANFSHPPSALPGLVDALREYDLVIASRYALGGQDQRTGSRAWMSRLFNLCAYLALGKVRDYSSGFVAVRRSVLDETGINVKSRHGEYFVSFVHSAGIKGARIKEIPFTQAARRRGRSKFSAADCLHYLLALAKLKLGG